ncbi:MAG: Do family serine endopeptidase [Gemmatimonadota bacterium]|jgi:serine protease Do
MFQSRLLARRTLALFVALLAACGGQQDALAQEQQQPSQNLKRELGTVPANVDTLTAENLSATFRVAAKIALPAVVFIKVVSKEQAQHPEIPPQLAPFFNIPNQPQVREGAGSGFIYTKDGYIITNRHVVANATDVQVTLLDGRVFTAKVVGADPNTDIAVIKIDPKDGKPLPVSHIGNSDDLQVGDWVLALGNPLGLQFTVTAGIVSAKGRSIGILQNQGNGNGQPNQSALEAYIQTDASINPGNSGGPLVNLLGQVVGINSAIISSTGEYAGQGFAIPVDLAIRVAKDLIKYGHVRRPRLGVLVGPVSDADAQLYKLPRISGALVSQVQKGSPADEAGLKMGDVIETVNGDSIQTNVDLTTKLARLEPGDVVTLGIMRNGKPTRVKVKLGEFPTEKTQETTTDNRPRAERLLGFKTTNLTNDIARQCQVPSGAGVVVTSVDPISPAAGRVGRCTVVLSINGKKVNSPSDVEHIAADLKSGDVVSLKIIATGQTEPQITNYRIR